MLGKKKGCPMGATLNISFTDLLIFYAFRPTRLISFFLLLCVLPALSVLLRMTFFLCIRACSFFFLPMVEMSFSFLRIFYLNNFQACKDRFFF
jgi:hypothetical protein